MSVTGTEHRDTTAITPADSTLRTDAALSDSLQAVRRDSLAQVRSRFFTQISPDSIGQRVCASAIRTTELESRRQPGSPLQGDAGTDSVLLCVIVLLLTVEAFCSRVLGKCYKVYFSELFGERKRTNMFDDDHRVPFTGALLSCLHFIVFGGAALYFGAIEFIRSLPYPSAVCVGACAAIAGFLYFFRYAAYSVCGYAFTDAENRQRWLTGYASTQAFAGVAMTLPVLLLLFFPVYREMLTICCLIIYGIFEILFICKGFRIFYCNFASLLYFILYLCTLEIIPILGVYRIFTHLNI